jgi:predicted RNase H-like HicB family nuclease
MMRYAIVIENAGSNFSAYVPDLPACIATGATVQEVEREIRDEDGEPVPPARSATSRSWPESAQPDMALPDR